MTEKTIFPTRLKNNDYKFTVWAPKARSVRLLAESPKLEITMNKEEFGYWSLIVSGIDAGTRYRYELDGNNSFPDPASLSQPDGVHEASEVIDIHDFEWTDDEWVNIPLDRMIQYELHTGTFSAEGTFEGVIARLDYLKNLGVNTIELLPVAQFSGFRNWGYDGVYPFAVHDGYGGAKELMKLVNTCHQKGIAVILDVVYNHFGPEGNYVSNFGDYFSGKYSTPWGEPLNFDDTNSDEVKNYFLQNALMWCRDFHIDGLRLDAVHAIYDFSAEHIMKQLAGKLDELSQQTEKPYYLIAESNLNDVRYISSHSKGGYGLNGQWSDDFHHAIHALATNETRGYYEDFGTPEQLSKAIKQAFVFDGLYSKYRKKTYGNSTKNNSGEQFVIFSQNHDQVGNRKHGERLISLSSFEMAKLVAGCMFVSPNVPMLFMGEEYGERNPFYYFVSHLDEELNRLVNEGRKEEFKTFFDDKGEAVNPASEEAFERSKLSWGIQKNPEYQSMYNYYKKLIELRKNHPVLQVPDKDKLTITENGKGFTLHRWQGDRQILAFMNFDQNDTELEVPFNQSGNMDKILDSTSTNWNGKGETSPQKIIAGETIKVAKEAILIYSN
ncbi:malto-oligosyltrehalose trehalohydrolase [Sunxiuqinia indica]|uniref:malto-oligosyltrehalose trehalohydrolase n=1 Tax=Sunxiuqinia indica TaxID=2692584 RepID=UPI00135BE987|nr:malto-oligosyltrehalose trehalohydrolase [Sunxiuqinia indica]